MPIFGQQGSNSSQEINTFNLRKKSDFLQTSTTLKEKVMDEISQKFDIEKIKTSLIIDFLEYERDDNLINRKKITLREEKLVKFEKILRVWVESSENFKKAIDNLINSFNNFGVQTVSDLEIFDDCPDVISLIYCLQGVMSDMNSHFKIFSVAIENSFTNPLREVLNIKYPEMRENRQLIVKLSDEFNINAAKILNTKKNLLKETVKENYLSMCKTFEFSRYDYISKINLCLLFIKVDLPEKISLLIYAFIVRILA